MHARDTLAVVGELFAAIKVLVSAKGHELIVCKKSRQNLAPGCAGNVPLVRGHSESTICTLANCVALASKPKL